MHNLVQRDHGGGVDAAAGKFGGVRGAWLDLSTGINPVAYPLPEFEAAAWTALPDMAANEALIAAAREFWKVPAGAHIVPANGASALIAAMPHVLAGQDVDIPAPTYNEHAAAFNGADWTLAQNSKNRVLVHPNNPDGRIWSDSDFCQNFTVVDESFFDVIPESSLVRFAARRDVVVLKSFGKFWGLAGVRLGFAICHPETARKLSALMGPWSVSGPALQIGAAALGDHVWAADTRKRLAQDVERLDGLLESRGAKVIGGTTLFRLVEVSDAHHWQDTLAGHHIWTRIFPYSKTWVRFGLPGPDGWERLEKALADL